MAIVDIQRRFRQLGRIRAGAQEANKSGKGTHPVKLDRFRLTSPWQHLIEQAADVYGGTATPWHNPGTKADEWEVRVETEALPVVVPPGQVFDQWYELWTGGGCQRRCDGVTQVLVDRPCQCPEDPLERQEQAGKGAACKPTTRLRLMLPDVADVGIWLLESHGFHAAAELGGAAGLVEAATRQGAMIPADLRLAFREGSRRPGQQRRTFYVPALSFRGTLGPVLDALGILEVGSEMPALLGVEGRPPIGAPAALPAGGTPFDPRTVEPSSLPGPPPTPPAQGPPAQVDPGEGTVATPRAFAPPTRAEQDPGPVAPDPEPMEPPPYDEEAERAREEGGERSYSGPQLIAIKLGDLGVKDRDERLRVVAAIVGRELVSSKDLNPKEVQAVLSFLNRDDGETEAFWERFASGEVARDTNGAEEQAPDAQERPPATAGPNGPPIQGELVERPPATRRRPAPQTTADDPKSWDGDRWRAVLKDAGKKPTALMREADRLARSRDVEPPPNLDAIAGSGLAEDLAGWVFAGGDS